MFRNKFENLLLNDLMALKRKNPFPYKSFFKFLFINYRAIITPVPQSQFCNLLPSPVDMNLSYIHVFLSLNLFKNSSLLYFVFQSLSNNTFLCQLECFSHPWLRITSIILQKSKPLSSQCPFTPSATSSLQLAFHFFAVFPSLTNLFTLPSLYLST